MPYPKTEIDRLRSLAEQVAAIAAEPRMAAIRKRWADVNALRKPDRAPVWCKPVGCWKEIITDDLLKCAEPPLRAIESQLLQIIYKRGVDDDQPVEGFYGVGASMEREPRNTWGVDIRHRTPAEKGGAWGYDPPLKRAEDMDRLTLPVFRYDAAATRLRCEQTAEWLGGVLPVAAVVEVPLGATLGTAAAELRGLEQMMVDMIAEPRLMHRLMGFLRDATLSAIDRLEASGALTPNNSGPMNCSDPIGRMAPGGTVTCMNLWCMANSQEFDQVSPEMWEEFCLEYQKPILERYGLVGYGCCENLTHKLDAVLRIPNLRILTCSAWTNLDAVIEKAGRGYCIMWRQKASDVVFPDDAATIRNDLLAGARKLQGCRYQIVLRELQTLAGHKDRLHEWTRYAKEAAERYA